MRTISEQALKDILDKHGKWLRKNYPAKWKLSKELNYSYFISDKGHVASIITSSLSIRKTPMLLKKRFSKNGYQIISLNKVNKTLHRVIAAEFIGNVAGKIVHHKNGIKTDNRVSNLEITDSSKNNAEGRKTKKKMYGQFIKQCHELFLEVTK